MVPNTKKTKQLLIATRQKLQNVNQVTLDFTWMVWRKVFPLSNDLNTQRELGALTLD